MRKNELKLALGDIQYVSVQYQYTACAAYYFNGHLCAGGVQQHMRQDGRGDVMFNTSSM